MAGQVCTELSYETGQGPQFAYCKAIGLHVCASPWPHWGASRSSMPVMALSTSSHVHYMGARVLTIPMLTISVRWRLTCLAASKHAPFCWAACLAVMFIFYKPGLSLVDGTVIGLHATPQPINPCHLQAD